VTDVIGGLLRRVGALLHHGCDENLCEVKRVLDADEFLPDLRAAADAARITPETLAVELVSRHRVLHDDAATLEQECKDLEHYQQTYRGRVVLELLQNLHDSVAACEGLPEIGKFGLGVKSLGGVCDRILLRSRPFALRFDRAQARSTREEMYAGSLPMPLFLLPFRMSAEDVEIEAVPACAPPGLGILESRGRRWLWYSHHGKEFSARDVDGFRRRHSTGKRRADAALSSRTTRTVLLFRLLQGDEQGQVSGQDVASELERLTGQALLFLPALQRLRVDTPAGVRDISVETELGQDDLQIVTTLPDGRRWLRWWRAGRRCTTSRCLRTRRTWC